MEIEPHLDTSAQIIDLLSQNNVDASLQKSIMRLKYLYPSYLQSKLLSLSSSKRLHYFVCSPMHSGKTLGLGLHLVHYLLESFIKQGTTKELISGNNEIPVGVFAIFLCASREICQKNTLLLQQLLHFTEKPYKIVVRNLMDSEGSLNLIPNCHYILVATPTAFLSTQRTLQLETSIYKALILDDCEYLRSFGYLSELEEIKAMLSTELSQMLVMISSSEESVDIGLKDLFLKKCVKIIVEDNEEEDQAITNEALQLGQINQIYNLGPIVHKFIVLYLCFKLKLIFGKTIILCADIPTLYRVELFLKRTGVEQTHIYNPKDPKNLRSYIVSVFNTGLLQTLITTPTFFKDLKQLKTLQKADSDTGEKVWRKVYLKNVQNIILFDFQGTLPDVSEYFSLLKELFKTRSQAHKTFISLIEQKPEEIELLSQLIELQKKDYKSLSLRPFPLQFQEIEAFNYRISDVLRSITKKQVQSAQMLDFKRQMLKSKSLQNYFVQHAEEKTLLQKEIQKLSADLNRNSIRLYEDIPDYLMPQSLKETSSALNLLSNKKRSVSTRQWNENFEKSLKKRMENNQLSLEDVKKLPKESDKKIVIDEEKEDPALLDPNYLKPLSNRKMWKIRHKFKLKKRNQRLEKKGIFQS